MWDDLKVELPDFEVIAPDLPALILAVGGRLGCLVRALRAILPSGPLLVTGCGVGAAVALEVAASLGERLRGVLLLAPPPLRPDPRFRERLRSLSRILLEVTDPEDRTCETPLVVHRDGPRWERAAPQARIMLRLAGGAAAAPLVQAAADFPDAELALRRIDAPVHALFAAESLDPFAGPEHVDDWEQALGPERVERIPLTRQWLPLECPERVAQALRRFP